MLGRACLVVGGGCRAYGDVKRSVDSLHGDFRYGVQMGGDGGAWGAVACPAHMVHMSLVGWWQGYGGGEAAEKTGRVVVAHARVVVVKEPMFTCQQKARPADTCRTERQEFPRPRTFIKCLATTHDRAHK
jgi:hypothetical protein